MRLIFTNLSIITYRRAAPPTRPDPPITRIRFSFVAADKKSKMDHNKNKIVFKAIFISINLQNQSCKKKSICCNDLIASGNINKYPKLLDSHIVSAATPRERSRRPGVETAERGREREETNHTTTHTAGERKTMMIKKKNMAYATV